MLIGNHTTEMTPAWALNPGPGKVKVVSVYFDLKRKMESNHVGLMEEDSMLGAKCFSAGQDLRGGAGRGCLTAHCSQHSKQGQEEHTATRPAHLALSFGRVSLTDRLS